jgi:hypothetical protein
MMDQDTREMIEAIEKNGRKMRRDKRYAHQVYIRLGMMTPKGNLTRPWQQLKKIYGITPRYYEAIRRALA